MSDEDDDIPAPISFIEAKIKQSIGEGMPVTVPGKPGYKLCNPNSACTHASGHLVIDEKTTTIQCSACGEYVTAWYALLMLVRAESRIQEKYEALQRDIEQGRGFYEMKKTVKAQTCRHLKCFKLQDGRYKCVRCDQIVDDAKGQASESRREARFAKYRAKWEAKRPTTPAADAKERA